MPLRTYRIAPRKAAIEIDGARVSLYLPAYFGRRRWQFNAADLAVADLTIPPTAAEIPQEFDDPDAEIVLRRGVTIPYLPTTGPATPPNLALLFAAPVKVPPLRVNAALGSVDLPFGYFSTRATPGDDADAVLLRAVDPADAVNWITDAGAQRTDDPSAWITSHRPLATDPADRAVMLLREKEALRLRKFATVIGVVGLLLFAVGGGAIRAANPIGWLLLAAGFVGTFVVGWIRRAADRRLK